MKKNAFKLQSGMMSMDDLTELNDRLRGLQNFRLHEDGEYIFVAPTQIISAPKGSVALDKYGKISSYSGLPELIIAEDFVGIKPWLDKEYPNYKQPSPNYMEIFDYDLNKHLIDNILEFRNKIRDEEYFNSLDKDIQEEIKRGNLFAEESDGTFSLVPESILVSEDRIKGLIPEFISKYKIEVVFFSKPVIGIKLSEQESFYQQVSMVKTVETEEEAELYGVPKGLSFETPLKQAASLYLWAFSQIYEKPIYEKYSDMAPRDVRATSEFVALDDKRLVQQTRYRALTLVNRIPTNKRGDIEVESGERIPAYFGRMSVSSNTFKNVFDVNRESRANYEPSFRLIKAEIPKAEGNQRHHIGQQYQNMKFTEPGIVGSDGIKSDSNPFIHREDEEYSKRIKEVSLNFRFKEAFITQNSNSLGKDVTLAELNEMIRQILVPMYELTKESTELSNIKDSIKSFMIDKLDMTEEELEGKTKELEEGLEDAQFSGLGAQNTPKQPPRPGN